VRNSEETDACMNSFMNKGDAKYVNELVGYLRRSIKVRDDVLKDQSKSL